MTKSELVATLAEKMASLTRKETEVIVDTIFDSMVAALGDGKKIELRGFGSFRVKQRDARLGRNPRTGLHVDIPQKRTLLFKPAKELRRRVDQQPV